jgi:tRNA U34 5-methylaminomethyl-2-thiouridine-forming methyltransferase MnmC
MLRHRNGQGLGEMTTADQQQPLEWRDGDVPVATQFDDPYYSLENGLAETEHVFLAGNQLPQRFIDGFHVAELGFGTGLNLLALYHAWQEAGAQGVLHYTGFEAFPMSQQNAQRSLSAFFPESASMVIDAWNTDGFSITRPDLIATILIGDARQTVPKWSELADAWFLDGFAPSKNPELWEPDLLTAVANHTKPGGTCATYTAAGAVRRALADAGFDVTRTSGFGRKRHMTIGKIPI